MRAALSPDQTVQQASAHTLQETAEALRAFAPGDPAADAPYTPDNATHWSPEPSTIGEALDQLAARLHAQENP